MDSLIEFHGRLPRADKRPANPGRYDILFRLHSRAQGEKPVWSEKLESVDVLPGGFFRVVLGQETPIENGVFAESPRWLAIHVVRRGRIAAEMGPRIPLVGTMVQLTQGVNDLQGRLANLEKQQDENVIPPGLDRLPKRINKIKEWLDDLQTQITALEEKAESSVAHRKQEVLGARMDLLDMAGGRLDRIEDELEDLVGADGDVVDLNERMDRLEGQAPDLIRRIRIREENQSPETVETMQSEIEETKRRVQNALDAVAKASSLIQDSSGGNSDLSEALPRSGGALTGPLVIKRGGLEVLSGGVNCRGATVTSLEATKLIKSTKVIADSMEVRGDVTVDNPHRVLQIRRIEGREGSARKDGALHLNTRGGGPVVVGSEKASKGLQVCGAIAGDGVVTDGVGVAHSFRSKGRLNAGDVVVTNGSVVSQCRKRGDARVVGVVVENPGVILGGMPKSGHVAIAMQGVVPCRVTDTGGAISIGDLLVTSEVNGCAQKAIAGGDNAGCVLGKALSNHQKGEGVISILVMGR